MITHNTEIKLFSGNSNRPLAEAIAKRLNTKLSDIEVGHFSDGETSVHLNESVRGRDVFLIQSTSAPVNENLMELLVMIDAVKRASAGRITAVIPYFGYARQDRKAKPRDPITAKLVADILVTAGADRVLTMDLHAAQIQGFFSIPVDNLVGNYILTKYFKKLVDDDFVVVSPDIGSVGRARTVAAKLNCPMAIIDKRRPKANQVEIMNIIGDVQGKKCLLVDDMIDTVNSLNGITFAVRVIAMHRLLSLNWLKRATHLLTYILSILVQPLSAIPLLSRKRGLLRLHIPRVKQRAHSFQEKHLPNKSPHNRLRLSVRFPSCFFLPKKHQVCNSVFRTDMF